MGWYLEKRTKPFIHQSGRRRMLYHKLVLQPQRSSQAGHQLFANAAPRSGEVAKWLRTCHNFESHEKNRRSKPPWQQDETSPSWGYLQMLNLVVAVELHLQNRTCQPSPPAPSCGPSSRDGSWKLKARSLPSHHMKWTYSSLKNEHRALVKRHLRKSLRSRDADGKGNFYARIYMNLQQKCRGPESVPWSNPELNSYRKNLSVWTHWLRNDKRMAKNDNKMTKSDNKMTKKKTPQNRNDKKMSNMVFKNI